MNKDNKLPQIQDLHKTDALIDPLKDIIPHKDFIEQIVWQLNTGNTSTVCALYVYKNFLIVGNRVGDIIIYDITQDFKQVKTINAHSRAVADLLLCHGKLLSISFDGTIKFFNISDNASDPYTFFTLHSQMFPLKLRKIKKNRVIPLLHS